MGRLSEYFRYLETPPDEMENFKFNMCYMTITPESKKLRREYVALSLNFGTTVQ